GRLGDVECHPLMNPSGAVNQTQILFLLDGIVVLHLYAICQMDRTRPGLDDSRGAVLDETHRDLVEVRKLAAIRRCAPIILVCLKFHAVAATPFNEFEWTRANRLASEIGTGCFYRSWRNDTAHLAG